MRTRQGRTCCCWCGRRAERATELFTLMRAIRAGCKRREDIGPLRHWSRRPVFLRLMAALIGRVAEYVSGAAIDVEVVVAKEANENDVEVFRDLYGEAGWSTDAGDHRDPTHEGFLEEFEAGTSGEQEQ